MISFQYRSLRIILMDAIEWGLKPIIALLTEVSPLAFITQFSPVK